MTAATPLLVLVPGFPVDETDMSCLPAIQCYVEALGRRLPEGMVEVIAFQYPFECRSYSWRGISIHALGGGNSMIAKPRTWARAMDAGRRVISGRRQGVIHSFWLGECAFVGALLARRHAWKHVVSIGGREVRRRTIYGLLLRRSAFLLTAGSAHAAAAARSRLYREVDAVIPLGLDADRVASVSPESPSWAPDSPSTASDSPAPVPDNPSASRDVDILTVGSLTPVKRTEDVIEVAARLVHRHPDLSVEIVGDGPERAKLERRIRAAGLGDHVVLRGHLPRGDVLRLMRRTRVLLHPSEYESQGFVFLEAAASGAFVVCRDVGFRPQGAGIHVAAGVDEMADRVGQCLDGPHPPGPVRVPTADESVDAFLKLYAG